MEEAGKWQPGEKIHHFRYRIWGDKLIFIGEDSDTLKN